MQIGFRPQCLRPFGVRQGLTTVPSQQQPQPVLFFEKRIVTYKGKESEKGTEGMALLPSTVANQQKPQSFFVFEI